MSNYIYLMSNTKQDKYRIDYHSEKNTGYSAIRTLESLHYLKTIDPKKIINSTNLSIDQLAQQILENHENKYCALGKLIDNFIQCFTVTKRGRVYQIYQDILKSSPPASEKQITQVNLPDFMKGIITAKKLCKFLSEKIAKLKTLEFQLDLTKIENDLSTLKSLTQQDPHTNSIARLKAVFNIAKSMKTICRNPERKFPEGMINPEDFIEMQSINQDLDCILMYLNLYIKTYGTERDKRNVSFSTEGNELLNQFTNQILGAVKRNIPK